MTSTQCVMHGNAAAFGSTMMAWPCRIILAKPVTSSFLGEFTALWLPLLLGYYLVRALSCSELDVYIECTEDATHWGRPTLVQLEVHP